VIPMNSNGMVVLVLHPRVWYLLRSYLRPNEVNALNGIDISAANRI